VALVVALSAAERPDYEEHLGGSVCRGWVYGDATVALKDQRTEIALFQPLGTILERRLGARSWRGEWGSQFTGFEGECANLDAQSGG
jgi:hypothetical protein